MNWTFKQKEFDESMMNNFGFIYKITMNDGMYYIGKKQILNYTYKQIINYNSSSKFIKENKHNIKSKEILLFTKNKIDTTYNEVKLQFKYNVLEDTMSLNQNILGCFYKGRILNNLIKNVV
jgi:hypothetical protein